MTDDMRIAFLSSTYDTSIGWGRYAAGFLSEAKRRLGEGNVVAPDPTRLASRDILWRQPFLALRDAFALRRGLKDVDLIHAAIEPMAPLAYFLSILLRKPLVISVCGTFADLDSYSRSVRWLYRLAFRRAARMAVLSRYTLKVLLEDVPDAKTEIVYGGYEPSRSGGPRQERHDPRRILSVGALKPRKGFHTLIEALAIFAKRGIPFRCDIVGPKERDGYVAKLEEAVARHGLDRLVTLHGRVPQADLDRLYAEADLFVLPSEHAGTAFEGLGLVYLEAMSVGVPSIGCLESGAEDVIKDGLNGRLVPPGRPELLAEAITDVLIDGDRWKAMSAASPGSVEAFRWEKVGADMESCYRHAVETYGR